MTKITLTYCQNNRFDVNIVTGKVLSTSMAKRGHPRINPLCLVYPVNRSLVTFWGEL